LLVLIAVRNSVLQCENLGNVWPRG